MVFDVAMKKIANKKNSCPLRVKVNNTKKGQEWNVELRREESDKAPDIELFEKTIKSLTATSDKELADYVYRKAIDAMPKIANEEENINSVLQVLNASNPNDHVEAKLCLQSHVLYAHGMKYLRLAEKEDRINTSEFFMKNALKLLRLHNETVEVLEKYKRKGEQKVVVQYVNVENGGKAVVGNMIS